MMMALGTFWLVTEITELGAMFVRRVFFVCGDWVGAGRVEQSDPERGVSALSSS